MNAEASTLSETPVSSDVLLFTDAAATKVGELIRGEGNPALMLSACLTLMVYS